MHGLDSDSSQLQVHNDDISQILILNKKSISSYETQLFEQELEKFRPYQTRLLQATHKQSALMKELTTIFNTLLQDKRVRSEQSKYEIIQRQRSSAINRYKRAYQEFLDLQAGLGSAKNWYAEMKETVESLEKNVDTFVNNRRSEGAQLLGQIEQDRSSNKSAQAELERERLRGLMERMSMDPTKSPPVTSPGNRPMPAPIFQQGQAPQYGQTSYQGQYQNPQSPPPHQMTMQHQQSPQSVRQMYPSYTSASASHSFNHPPPINTFTQQAYNPLQYGRTPGPTSPPPNQAPYSMRGPASPPATQTSFGQPHHSYSTYGNTQNQQPAQAPYVPPGFVPPPPPPGPPPLGPQQTIHYGQNQEYAPSSAHPQSAHPQSAHPQSAHPQSAQPRNSQSQQPHDPWAGLNAWQ